MSHNIATITVFYSSSLFFNCVVTVLAIFFLNNTLQLDNKFYFTRILFDQHFCISPWTKSTFKHLNMKIWATKGAIIQHIFSFIYHIHRWLPHRAPWIEPSQTRLGRPQCREQKRNHTMASSSSSLRESDTILTKNDIPGASLAEILHFLQKMKNWSFGYDVAGIRSNVTRQKCTLWNGTHCYSSIKTLVSENFCLR